MGKIINNEVLSISNTRKRTETVAQSILGKTSIALLPPNFFYPEMLICMLRQLVLGIRPKTCSF